MIYEVSGPKNFTVFDNVSDLLETNLTIWFLDNPFYYGLETDPRKDVRDMYASEHTTFFQLSEWSKVIDSNQATLFETNTHIIEMTGKILSGEAPTRRQLELDVALLSGGHYLRLNDVLSETTNTYLSRLMASGIVNKIYGKYQLSDGT